MPLDFVTVPSLTNGVSRQSPTLRLDSQAENQKNLLSSVTGGISDRPPARKIDNIAGAALPPDGLYHQIARDETEQYEVVIPGDGTIRVFAKDGTEQTVNAIGAAAQTYLTSTGNARTAFRARTISDFTFVTNREIDTAMGAAASASQDNTCLIWVRQTGVKASVNIGMSSTYSGDWTWINYDEAQTPFGGTGNIVTLAAISTDLTDPEPVPVAMVEAGASGSAFSDNSDTQYYAQKIYRALSLLIANHVSNSRGANGNSMETWTLRESLIAENASLKAGKQSALGSVVTLSSSDPGDVDVRFTTGSGNGGDMVKIAHGSVESLQDLPGRGAPPGFKIRVLEESADALDDWYVEFDGESWVEVVGFEVPLGFDADTMPHTLKRESNGTFTFEPFSWADRTAGDEASNPDPGFIGKPIKNFALYKNRLSFVYEDGVAFSEAGEFSNFFNTTSRQLLASDPIDISIDAGSGVPRYESAVPYDQALLVWAANGQAVVQGTDIFSAETVSADLATEYEADLSLEPIATGNTFLFQAPGGSVWEYLPGQSGGQYAAIDVTAHIPGYLPGDFAWSAVSRADSIVVFGSASQRNKLYVYRYFYDGANKIQSSWSEWEFNEDISVFGGDFFGSELVLFSNVVSNAGGNTTKMMLSLDLDATPETGFVDPLYLDAIEALTVGPSDYNATLDKTFVLLPYGMGPDEGYIVVLGDGSGTRFGEVHPITTFGYTPFGQAEIPGEVADGATIYVGRTYERLYEPSRFVLRSPSRDNRAKPQPVTNARVQLRRARVDLGRASYLRAEVARDGTVFSEKVFTTHRVGGVVGPTLPTDGDELEFAIGSNADRVRIQLINDTHLPTEILSLSYEAMYHNRSMRTR